MYLIGKDKKVLQYLLEIIKNNARKSNICDYIRMFDLLHIHLFVSGRDQETH